MKWRQALTPDWRRVEVAATHQKNGAVRFGDDMNRFWVFPIALAAAGAVFVVAAGIEGIAPLLPFAGFRLVNLALLLSMSTDFLPNSSFRTILSMATWLGLVHALSMPMARGAGVGALLGLIAAAFDAAHNGAKPRSCTQLGKNIAWCVLYAHAIIGVNVALVACASRR